jgi:hypothetical protein
VQRRRRRLRQQPFGLPDRRVLLADRRRESGNPCRACDPAQSVDSHSAAVGNMCGASASNCSQQDTCNACRPSTGSSPIRAPMRSPAGKGTACPSIRPNNSRLPREIQRRSGNGRRWPARLARRRCRLSGPFGHRTANALQLGFRLLVDSVWSGTIHIDDSVDLRPRSEPWTRMLKHCVTAGGFAARAIISQLARAARSTIHPQP